MCIRDRYIGKTIFVDFSIFYGILFQSKRPSFKSLYSSDLASAGRPSRSTDVHRCARQFWQEGRSTDPVDRPESSALWKGPGRPGGRSDREQCSLYLTSVDRLVDRWHNGLKYDHWPVDRAVDRQATWLPTASFSSSINWDIWGLFSLRF